MPFARLGPLLRNALEPGHPHETSMPEHPVGGPTGIVPYGANAALMGSALYLAVTSSGLKRDSTARRQVLEVSPEARPLGFDAKWSLGLERPSASGVQTAFVAVVSGSSSTFSRAASMK